MQEAITDFDRTNKKPDNSGRLQLVLIFLLPLLVIGVSTTMYFSGLFIPDGRTNKGELILPPKALTSLQLSSGSGVFTADSVAGRWTVLVIGDGACISEQCQETMYQTRQAIIALGKETGRVARAYVAADVSGISEEFKTGHPDIFWLSANKGHLPEKLGFKDWPANRYFIIDPLGNVMMGYKPAQYGGDLLQDIKKLLKASKIG